jgi:glycosyltransferase involved in cell wall biosynthesis
MKHLLFFTSQFPFGTGETFIENELPFLTQNFEKVWIVTNDTTSTTARNTPANVNVVRVSSQVPVGYKLKALAGFFKSIIQEELKFIRQKLKLPLSSNILSVLLGGYAEALYLADVTAGVMKDNRLTPASSILYSYWMSNVAAGLALYKLRNPAIAAVCRAHGWDVYFERHQPPYLPLRSFTIGYLDYCCCISANGKEYLQRLTGISESKFELSRLGTFNKEERQRGGNTGKLCLVSCSNIIALKRVHLIIEALALISDINIEWTHFGTGPLEAEVKKLAEAKLGGHTNIKYSFAGQVSNPALLDYYAQHKTDLLVNVSETEGLPVSMMEANSFGIPVIATNVGGVSEIITNGLNGFLIGPDGKPSEIAEHIKGYYALNDFKKEALRNNSFEAWRKNYNAAVNYPGFINLLNSI